MRSAMRSIGSLLVGIAVVSLAPGFAGRAAAGTELYVSAEESGEIVVLSADLGTTMARIPVGKRPRGVKVSHDGKLLYVALSGSPRAAPGVDESKLPPPDRSADGVGVVDLEKHKLVRTYSSGQDPESFDLSKDGKTGYLGIQDSDKIAVVSIADRKIIRVFDTPAGAGPDSIEPL